MTVRFNPITPFRHARNPRSKTVHPILSMTILHVTDLHLEPRWFEWLITSAPRHIHEPESWFEQKDGVLFVNPGATEGGRFPNHVLFDLETFTLRRVTDSAVGARCEIASWPPPARESEEGLVHA
ncbi:MAG: hypothetical protein ACREIA_15405 [Opitutaceae bacterium]